MQVSGLAVRKTGSWLIGYFQRDHGIGHKISKESTIRAVFEKMSSFGLVASAQVAADLFHPRGIRTRRDPGNVDATGFQMHHSENVERHQSVSRPDFDSREVRGKDRFPVGLQKR